jgi:hypothetical protein
MKRLIYHWTLISIILTLILSGCEFPAQRSGSQDHSGADSAVPMQNEPDADPSPTPQPPTETETSEAATAFSGTDEETSKPTEDDRAVTPTTPPTEEENEANPESESEADAAADEDPPSPPINPLTGLPVDDADLLALPPALLSISNFPASARPQAGLNSSPLTFEMTIGEGMTRFLAVFYGGFPSYASGQTEGQPAIGPIRSGRLPYEAIRASYNGFLVMASAYSGVAQTLSGATSIYGSDSDDINSALIDIEKLYDIAQAQSERTGGQTPYLEGMTFSETPPENGQQADNLWIFYSSLNQIQWRYDPETSAYIRHDITTDGSGAFPESTDRLTGEPISKENVIILFAHHDFKAPTLIDIQLANMPPMPALLFRDGKMYEIFWTTRFGDFEKETGLMRPIRFVDAEGNPFPLKPGQTWVQIVTDYSYYLESAESETPFYGQTEAPGSGFWLVRYKGKY